MPPRGSPSGAPPGPLAGAPQPPPPLPPPPSSAAAHAADLERQIRRRSWLAALAIAAALAAAGVALYLAIDTRDNSVKKDELRELTPATKTASDASATQIDLAIAAARAKAATQHLAA